jgi:hypothetical protein
MPVVHEQSPGIEEGSTLEEECLPADRPLVSNDFTTTARGRHVPDAFPTISVRRAPRC